MISLSLHYESLIACRESRLSFLCVMSYSNYFWSNLFMN